MKKVGFVSLGCPKNLVDSEVMMGTLAASGYEITSDASEADTVVVNTCGFIESAKQESIDAILEATRWKQNGEATRVIVAGCLVERYRDDLMKELPEVDAFIGTSQVGDILKAADEEFDATQLTITPIGNKSSTYLYDEYTPRMRATNAHTAFIKIAEGCDRPCAFCSIPGMRGSFRSRRFGSIIEEARQLANDGVRELVLIAQDSSRYGEDLGEVRPAPHRRAEHPGQDILVDHQASLPRVSVDVAPCCSSATRRPGSATPPRESGESHGNAHHPGATVGAPWLGSVP